jgi:hypothetical protein
LKFSAEQHCLKHQQNSASESEIDVSSETQGADWGPWCNRISRDATYLGTVRRTNLLRVDRGGNALLAATGLAKNTTGPVPVGLLKTLHFPLHLCAVESTADGSSARKLNPL